MNQDLDQRSSLIINAVIAGVLTFCLGPVGAFLSWWLLGNVGFMSSLIRTLAYVVLCTFIFGLLVLLSFFFAAASPIFALPMLPAGVFIYFVLEIILIVSAVRCALHPESRGQLPPPKEAGA